ncbi:MAG: glycosyltransferase family 87 protein [Candidatus Xenobiia bacterium LiM19]
MSAKFKLYYKNPGDDANYFVGALMLRNGYTGIYDYNNFLQFCQGHTLYKDKSQFLSFMIYPPLMYVLIVPLTLLHLAQYIQIWFLLNILLLALSAFLISQCLIRAAGVKIPVPASIMLLISSFLTVFLYSPTVDCLMQGQANILLLFLFSSILYCYLSDRKVLAGLFLALCISIKLFPVLFLLYFAIRREWKVVLWTLLCTFIINLAIFLIYGQQIFSSYIENIFPLYFSSQVINVFPYNRSIEGVILYYLPSTGIPVSSHLAVTKAITFPLKLLLLLLSMAVIFQGAKKAENSGDALKEKAVSFCLFLSLVYLVLTSSWQYYHIWYLLCFVIIIGLLSLRELDFRNFISAVGLSFSWFWFSSLDGQISVWHRQLVWWMRNHYYNSFPFMLVIVKLFIFFALLFLYRELISCQRQGSTSSAVEIQT